MGHISDEHPLMIPVAIGASSFIGGAVIGAIIGAILVQKLRTCKNRRGQNEGTQQDDPELTLMVPPVTLSAPDDEHSEGYRTDTSPEATPPSPRAASPHPCNASNTVSQPVANDSGDLAL
ncbi:hypothetical protein BaRGS_00006716 [Batillaria attramentaria]|uniref:Uncharacterized protein n=1 Tax=Batillaria attramentaria TaxID=370345 RepID=A0ABD0LQK5_9CAEN